MHPERLILKINVVQNYIFDSFYCDHKAVRSNLTELFFCDFVLTFFVDNTDNGATGKSLTESNT